MKTDYGGQVGTSDYCNSLTHKFDACFVFFFRYVAALSNWSALICFLREML